MSVRRLEAPEGEMEFVLENLPRPPARILELGCGGGGSLTLALAEAGYTVFGVDPEAPENDPAALGGRKKRSSRPAGHAHFRRERIEDHRGGPYDAAVAARSLHHVSDLDAVLSRIARVSPRLLLAEFAWERFDEATAAWYEETRRRVCSAGQDPHGPPASEWRRKHSHLHTMDAMRAALDRHFRERRFRFTPYLHYYLDLDDDAPEAAAIEAGLISAIGFRYVGESRSSRRNALRASGAK